MDKDLHGRVTAEEFVNIYIATEEIL